MADKDLKQKADEIFASSGTPIDEASEVFAQGGANVVLDPISIEGDTAEEQDFKTSRLATDLRATDDPAEKQKIAEELATRLNQLYGANVDASHLLEQAQVGQKTTAQKIGQAALPQLIKGATFGAAPYIAAAPYALQTDQSYGQALDETQRAFDMMYEEAPATSFGANIAGGIVTGGQLGKGVEAMSAKLISSPAFQSAAKAVGVPLADAAEGFTHAMFETEGDVKESLKAAGLSMAFSGTLQAGKAAGKGGMRLARSAGKRSVERASKKAIGELADMGFPVKARERLVDRFAKGKGSPEDMVRWIKTNIPDGTKAQMAKDALELGQSIGNQMDEVVSETLGKSANAPIAGREFFEGLADRLQSKAGETGMERDVLKKAIKFVERELDNIDELNLEGYSLKALRRLRSKVSRNLGRLAEKGGDADAADQIDAFGMILDQLDSQIEGVLDEMGDQAGVKLRSLYKQYGNAADTYHSLKSAAAKPMSKVAGLGGAFSGNPALKAVDLVAEPAGRWAMEFVDKHPKLLKEALPGLIEAGNRGVRPLIARLFVLQRTNPEVAQAYRDYKAENPFVPPSDAKSPAQEKRKAMEAFGIAE